MKADLHVHTIHSDGVCYVGEIIELAKSVALLPSPSPTMMFCRALWKRKN